MAEFFFSLLPWAPVWLDMAELTIHHREGPPAHCTCLTLGFLTLMDAQGSWSSALAPVVSALRPFSSPLTFLINSPSFTSFSICQFLHLENGDNKWYL